MIDGTSTPVSCQGVAHTVDKTPRRTRAIAPATPVGPDTRQMGSPAVKSFFAILTAIVMVISGTGYFTVGQLGNTLASAGNLSLGEGQGIADAKDGATDILLVGSDSRTDAQGNPLTQAETDMLHAGDEEADNTDTIMVIRVPNDGSSATAISVPRDTYISDPTFGNMKINGVYTSYKGAERERLYLEGLTDEKTLETKAKDAGRKGLVEAISRLTGVTVDHYAEIGLLGFVLLTDAVGGVEVCLNEEVYDEFSGADFPAGRQTLSGAQGLSFVRQRHGLPRGDLDRIVRQQAFMASLVSKVLSSGTLTSPTTLSDLSQAVSRSVVIDENWDVMSFASQLQDLAGGNVTFNTIPVTSIDGIGDLGESIVTVDLDEVHTFFESLLSAPPEEPSAPAHPESAAATTDQSPTIAGVDIHVLNYGTIQGLAANIASHLDTKGYNIVETGNAAEGLYSSSQILAQNPTDPRALTLAQELGGLDVVANGTLDNTTFIVVAGGDYTGPLGDASTASPTSPTRGTSPTVGQPGQALETHDQSPALDAGSNSPRCVN